LLDPVLGFGVVRVAQGREHERQQRSERGRHDRAPHDSTIKHNNSRAPALISFLIALFSISATLALLIPSRRATSA
jgi:hypothetical protein